MQDLRQFPISNITTIQVHKIDETRECFQYFFCLLLFFIQNQSIRQNRPMGWNTLACKVFSMSFWTIFKLLWTFKDI